jgi:hypothetical protein
MALTAKRGAAATKAAVEAMGALLNSGYLRIYDSTGGTGQPATGDTAIGSQILLAELTFAATAFGTATAGVITAAAIGADSDANATGTATWFRCFKTDGTTPVYDGSVGTTGCDLNLNTASIVIHAAVSVTALTLTEIANE